MSTWQQCVFFRQEVTILISSIAIFQLIMFMTDHCHSAQCPRALQLCTRCATAATMRAALPWAIGSGGGAHTQLAMGPFSKAHTKTTHTPKVKPNHNHTQSNFTQTQALPITHSQLCKPTIQSIPSPRNPTSNFTSLATLFSSGSTVCPAGTFVLWPSSRRPGPS